MPTIDRGGITISYRVHGVAGGTPLLLTHGYSASSSMWRGNVEALSRGRPVVTWDIRGHGHSASPTDPLAYSQALSVDDMTAILDACDMPVVMAGGLSLGGFLSLAFHLAHPERVAALLLFDTGPGFKREEGRRQWNAWVETTAESFEQSGTKALSSSPEVGTGPHDPLGLARAARGILAQSDDRVINSLPSVTVPTLVLVGSDDQLFLGPADYMAAKIPGATKVVIPDCGHAPNIDNPSAFNDAVTSFLEESDRTITR
jgi:pimeloyl-ACP methyl ester carboxylesterase